MGYHEKRDPKTGLIYRTFVVETIADHAKDHRFVALCSDCRHSKPIDMGYWIEKLGADSGNGFDARTADQRMCTWLGRIRRKRRDRLISDQRKV